MQLTLLVAFIFCIIIMAFFAFMVIKNDFSFKILDIYKTAIVALLVSSFFIFKTIWLDEDSNNFNKDFSILFIHEPNGNILPLWPLFKKTPTLISEEEAGSYISYNNSLIKWINENPDLKNIDDKEIQIQYFYDFEAFLYRKLSYDFKYGWTIDDSRKVISPVGGFTGSIGYTTPTDFIEKIFLKEKVIPADANPFITNDKDKYFQLAIPKGTNVSYHKKDKSLGGSIRFTHDRFTFKITYSMFDQFNLHGIRNSIPEYFFKNLLNSLGFPISNEQDASKVRFRTFHLYTEFKQNPLYRFSEKSEFDALFAKNIVDHFYKRYSWKEMSKRIEQALSSF
ncbi:hypothetical protein ABMA77_06650 [Halobacteriovorax sp. RZ-1]|uniref:hypothetical protein n=1 Tax=unclassified Halobacteriovorax TaxID=2639665 RepID=UPI0037219533